MTEAEAAEFLRMPEATLRRHRAKSDGPPTYHPGGSKRPLYRVDELRKWATNQIECNAETGVVK